MHYINSSDVSEFLEKVAFGEEYKDRYRIDTSPRDDPGSRARVEGYGRSGVPEFTRSPAAQARHNDRQSGVQNEQKEQRIGDMYNDDNEREKRQQLDIYQKGNQQRENIARATRDEENTPFWKKPGVQKSPKRSIPSVNDPTKFVNSVGRRLGWQ